MPFSADLRDSSWQPRSSRICFPLPFLTVFSQWQKTPEQQQAAVSSSAAWANYVRKSNNFFPRVVVHPSSTHIAFDSELGWVCTFLPIFCLHISADFLSAHFCRFFVCTLLPIFCFHISANFLFLAFTRWCQKWLITS